MTSPAGGRLVETRAAVTWGSAFTEHVQRWWMFE